MCDTAMVEMPRVNRGPKESISLNASAKNTSSITAIVMSGITMGR